MESNLNQPVKMATRNKGGRPKGSKNKGERPKLRSKLEPNPEHVALIASGLGVGEGEGEAAMKAVVPVDLKKKYPIASKWPSMKFWHAMVIRGDYYSWTVEVGDSAAIPLTIDRGVGSPVNILLGRQIVLPDEIVEAVRDMTNHKYPKVLSVNHPGEIPENAGGINAYESRSRYKVIINGPATPEEYEAGVLVGPHRRD